MKKTNLLFALAVIAFGFASCGVGSTDYMVFVGTWGLDRLEYYNIDYAGNPIPGSFDVYQFTPGDPDNGIDLVFRSDKTGEMRDRSRDTLYIYDSSTHEILDTIPCPDTTLVTRFTYTYHKGDPLYMNMETSKIYEMKIEEMDDNSFTYINEYYIDYVEKAKMVRISNDTRSKAASTAKPVKTARHLGSLMSDY